MTYAEHAQGGVLDLEELRTAFKAANIVLVEIDNLDDADDSHSLRVVGDLADYISAVKALHIPVVFVCLERLEAHDFVYRPDDDEVDDEEESQEQDLCSVNVELTQFKERVGEDGSFTLYAAMQPNGLTYFIENAWYVEFWRCRDSATESTDQGYADSRANVDEEESKRLREVTARLNDLVNDKKFARLPTQKAMLAYAKLNVAGVDEMDSGTLKETISEIAAQIIAKGSE